MFNRLYYGIHVTSDIFFGTPDSTDPYCGSTPEILEDIRKTGRNAFVVEAIQAFASHEEASRRLENYLKNLPYNSYNAVNNKRSESLKGNQNATGSVRTDEFKSNLSELNSGENNPFYGKKHDDATKQVIAARRINLRWINNGFEHRQIPKDEPIPDGWVLGRTKKRALPQVESQAEKPQEDQGLTITP